MLNTIDLSVRKNEIVSIIGPSSAGISLEDFFKPNKPSKGRSLR